MKILKKINLMKKILIIGSTGTLGLSLCKIIKNLNNYEIIELSRKSKKTLSI